MVHERSKISLERRRLRRLIFAHSYQDKIRAETVSLISRVDVLNLALYVCDVSLVPDVVRGEVLVDSRGTGSFQVLKNDGG
jgi:hypothetical protein